MTELEQVLAMFDRAGVIYSRDPNVRGTILNCEAQAGPANEGYIGFAACLDFDLAGQLRSIGAWE